MSTPTPHGRVLSILAGTLFTAGALTILLEDVVLHSAPFALKHALTVITVAGTMMVGHLASAAKGGRHWLAMLGFAALFVTGTALTVYNSVGRQAEASGTKAAEAEASNAARADALAGLSKAEAMLDEARRDLARECKSGRGKRCDGIAATIAVYEAAARGHRADLAALGPQRIANPEARRAGQLAAVFGVEAGRVEAGAVLAVPFLTTLLFEFGAIVSLGYGLKRRAAGSRDPRLRGEASGPSARDTAQTSFANHPGFPDSSPDGPGSPIRSSEPLLGRESAAAGKGIATVIPLRVRTDGADRKEAVLRAIRTDINAGRTFPSQRDLCRTFGVPRSTMSDWLTEWESSGAIPARRTVGRCKAVMPEACQRERSASA